MADSGGIEAGKAFVRLYTERSAFDRGLTAASASLKSWGASVTMMGAKISALGAIAVAPLVALAKVASSGGEQMLLASQRTGIAVESLSALKFAADQSGASFEDLENGIRKMQKAIGEAMDGSASAQEALGKLGVTIDQLQGKTGEEQLKMLATGLAGIRDPALQTESALGVFGKGGAALIPMLKNGAAGISRMTEEAKSLGMVMSTQTAEDMAKGAQEFRKMTALAKGTATAFGAAVVPALTEVIQALIPYLASAKRFVKDHKDLIVVALKAGAALLVIGAGVAFLGRVIALGATAINLFKMGLSAVGLALKLVTVPLLIVKGLIGLFTFVVVAAQAALLALTSPLLLIAAAVVGLGAAFFVGTGEGKRAATVWGQTWKDVKDSAVTAWNGITDAIGARDLALAGKIAFLGLKAVWFSVVLALKDTWAGFTGWFVEIWDKATTGLAVIFSDVWAGIQTGWANAVAFMRSLWSGFTNIVKNTGALLETTLENLVPGGGALNAARKKANIDKDADQQKADVDRRAEFLRKTAAAEIADKTKLAAELERIDAEAVDFKTRIDKKAAADKEVADDPKKALEQKIEANNKEREEVKAAIQKEQADKLAEIEKDRAGRNKVLADDLAADQARRKKEREDALAGPAADVAAAKKELADAAAGAAKKREEQQKKAGAIAENPETQRLGGTSPTGTFSGVAAAGLGAGTIVGKLDEQIALQKKQVKAAEDALVALAGLGVLV